MYVRSSVEKRRCSFTCGKLEIKFRYMAESYKNACTIFAFEFNLNNVNRSVFPLCGCLPSKLHKFSLILIASENIRACSQIPVYGLTGRGLGGCAGHGILRAKPWNKVYSMRRYPFMNNNGCQICILLPNLLV